MATYFLFGKYNPEAVHQIGASRTRNAVGIIEKHNGQITSMYGLLGEYDLVFIVNLPGNVEAMQVSIELSRTTGIIFVTAPAISVEKFDELLEGDRAPSGMDQVDIGDLEHL